MDKALEVIQKKIESKRYAHDINVLWADMLEVIARTLQNSVFQVEKEEEIIARICAKYDPKENIRDFFAEILADLVIAMERHPFTDILGPIHMNLASNEALGQFFTPQSLCDLMNELVMQDQPKQEETDNTNTFYEPACGMGAIALSHAKYAHRDGVLNKTQFSCVDIAPNCVYGTYIQLALNGIAARVYCANTLSLEEKFEMITPMQVVRELKKRSDEQSQKIGEALENILSGKSA